ncbi:MAG: phage major capsid protein [Deltaproteobacteria bacterium]|jgi:HK97 family phage major capsid protein|nr:phage major capsid protein [Deltaproteobacteria bacterium]
MGYLSNRTILEKADLALADLTAGGGILKPAQAQKFMRLLIKESVLMKLATVIPMGSPKQQISKIKFGSRILRPGQEATALPLADRAKPDLSSVELDAQLFKAEVRLSDEVLEDSIERGELRQTIMEMMAEAISRDMEEILINGDTVSADPFLAVMDGILKQATSNVVDAAGTPISKTLLQSMLKTLPSEHLRDKKAMRFLTSVDADLDYRNTLADRATVAGDRLLESDTPVLHGGVPVQPIPLFPENLGATTDQTAVVLCNPKNVHVGIWRQIRLEADRDISEGTLKIVATLRFDVKFAEEPGVAKAINVQL